MQYEAIHSSPNYTSPPMPYRSRTVLATSSIMQATSSGGSHHLSPLPFQLHCIGSLYSFLYLFNSTERRRRAKRRSRGPRGTGDGSSPLSPPLLLSSNQRLAGAGDGATLRIWRHGPLSPLSPPLPAQPPSPASSRSRGGGGAPGDAAGGGCWAGRATTASGGGTARAAVAPGGGRGGSSGDGGGQWVGRAATASGGGRDDSSCDGAGRLGGRVATMPAGDLLSSSAVAGGLHAHRSTTDA